MDLPEPVTRKDALAAGFTDSELSGSGWHRLRRGVYLPTAAYAGNLTALQRHVLQASAAASASSDEAVISHVTAAVAHGLPIWAIPLERVHLSRSRRSGARSGPQTVLHAAPFAAADVVSVAGLQVTSVARTVVDLGGAIPLSWPSSSAMPRCNWERPRRPSWPINLRAGNSSPGAAGARRGAGVSPTAAEPARALRTAQSQRFVLMGDAAQPRVAAIQREGVFLSLCLLPVPRALGVILASSTAQGNHCREELRGTYTADDDRGGSGGEIREDALRGSAGSWCVDVAELGGRRWLIGRSWVRSSSIRC